MAIVSRTLERANRGIDATWARVPDLVFWIFMVGSAGYLGWTGVADVWNRVAVGTPGATNTYVFAINSPAWSAPGLTYEGLPGSMLAAIEGAAVFAGLALLFARRLRWRIAGSMLVVAWASLWAANATALAARTGGFTMWLLAAAYSLPLLASLIVTMRRMGGGRGGALRRLFPKRKRRRAPAIPPPPERLRGDSGEGLPRMKSGAAEPVVA